MSSNRMWSVVISVVSLLSVGATLARAAADPKAAASPRVDMALDADWRFVRSDAAGAEATAFNDAAWTAVTLPHTWDAGPTARGVSPYRGAAWYRRHLSVGPELAGKALFLRFGAASSVAKIYVNGKPAGTHNGGFSAFCFDVTALVHPGDNMLAVRVDDALVPDVAPTSGDFTIFGGLYRDARLIALDPVSLSPLDDASAGVYLKQSKVSDASADVEVATKLRNGSAAAAKVTVTCDVADAAGQAVAHSSVEATIPAHGVADSVGRFTIAKPHLWAGRADPYLYAATVTVTRDGAVVDRVTQPLGLRYFKVDPQRGFMLNGKPYDLHGVNLHQGRAGVGWASTAADQAEDYDMVADLGCTAVRMCHYQHAENEYALCDKLGIVVWSELALVNKVTPSEGFSNNVKQQLREMIKQEFNHPSICFWSLYNEPWVNQQMPIQQWHVVDELDALAHKLDPDRLTTGGVVAGGDSSLDWAMDVAAFNRYWGWYTGAASEATAGLDKILSESKGKTFGLSEYGGGASAFQHEIDPTSVKASSRWHPEEWQALVHEGIWPQLAARPSLWCKFVWVMFDFDSAGRDEGDRPGINDKGLVTADRKVPKDAFYYYKAQWSAEPFVHLTSRRFDPHPVGPVTLKAYSNCPSVTLFLDGQSLGEQHGANGVFTWPTTTLDEGKATLRAVAKVNGKEYADEFGWTVSPAAAAHPPQQAATGQPAGRRNTANGPRTPRGNRPAAAPK